jgi:uncharacterized protein YjbI with pentapeptide repeats
LRTQRRGKSALYNVSAFGLFDVATPEVFLSEQALWPAVMKELPEGSVFDQGMPKPQGELLVAGHAKAPNGIPVRGMMLEVALGALRKHVAVFGDRYWTPGASGFIFTEPQPFTEMQIDLRRMFGGTDHPQNTLGTGYQSTRLLDAQQVAALPNFEDPRRLIRTIDETPPPVGLGPIDPLGRDRIKYAGTYDKAWQETIAPHLPLDADPRIHCMAPEDQRISGFFAGDEPLLVKGMTPEEGGYGGRLPGLRARAFVMRTSAPAGFFELDMKLDTVLLLGSHGKGVVVFRGSIPIVDFDAKDVSQVMIAYERIRDVPRPLEHYAEVLRLRTDKKQAMKYVFAESQLTPDVSEAEKQRCRHARENYTRGLEQRFADGMHMMTRRQIKLAGLPESLVPANPEPTPLPVLLPTPEEIEAGDIDLAEIIDGMEKVALEARQKLETIRDKAESARGTDGSFDLGKLLADFDGFDGIETTTIRNNLDAAKTQLPSLDELLASLGDAPAETKDRTTQAMDVGGGFLQDGVLRPLPEAAGDDAFKEACGRFLDAPDAGIAGAIRGSLTEARKTIDALSPQDIPVSDKAPEPFSTLVASLTEQTKEQPAAVSQLAQIDQQLREKLPALAARPGTSLENLLHDLTNLTPGASANSPVDAPAILAEVDGHIENAARELKEGLAQLRRLAVEPISFNAPLTPAAALRFGMFVYDQWRQGVDLRGRDLAGADLSGMDFSGADITGAFLERTNLSRAIFRGAICQQAVFAGAKLDAACFDDAILKEANFSRASAKAASFQRANLENINAIEAHFGGANFEASHFAKTQMIKTDFAGARLVGAIVRNLIFAQCPLSGVEAAGATFERCQIVDCDAQNFSFRNGTMLRCAVVKFRAPQADFCGSTLDGTSFASAAELPGARFDGASLRGVTLQAANLAGARFVRACLDGAFVSESQIADSDFTCASLKRAQFAMADLSHCNFFAANFFQAQMRRANLSGARLRAANLYSANFADSNLTGADLTATNSKKSQLELETSHAQ